MNNHNLFFGHIICKYIKIGYIKGIERGEFMTYINTLKKRRSIYNLNNLLPISEDKLIENIEHVLLESPTAFHMQSPYLLVLMNDEHIKLWEITTNTLKQIVPEDKFKSTQDKMDMFTKAKGTILFFDNTKPTEETWFYRVDIPSDRKHFSKTKPMELRHFEDCVNWWNDRKEILDEEENPKAKKYTAQEISQNNYNLDLCGYPHEEEEILSIKDTILNYKKHSEVADEKINSTLAKITEILGIEL